MDSTNFVMENYTILVPVLYIIGVFLKGNPKIPNWIIPWVLLVCGIGLSIWMTGFGVQAVIQGIRVTGAAVLGNQLIKQTTEGINACKCDTSSKEKE